MICIYIWYVYGYVYDMYNIFIYMICIWYIYIYIYIYMICIWYVYVMYIYIHHILGSMTPKVTQHFHFSFQVRSGSQIRKRRVRSCHTWCHHDSHTAGAGLSVFNLMMATSTTGWWYTYPSEKYESQLGWWHSQYMEKNMFQPTNQTMRGP